ncbi:MAG: NifU family protein [Patescibacteria group bacterium]
MEKEIIKIINKIRPAIKTHGGDVEFLGLDKKNMAVKVKLKGACSGCPLAALTLKETVLSAIKEKLPQIKDVINSKK